MRIPLRQYWALLVSYLKPQRPRALALAALLGASIGLQLTSPQILRYFVDTATGGGAPASLVWAALLFIGVALVNQAVSVTATYTSENVGWTATNALRRDLAAHCLRLDMSFHKSHTPGEMIERLDGDVTALASFFSQFVVYVLGNAVLLLGVLAVLFRVDWRAGLAFTIFSLAALALLARTRDIAVPHWEAARQAAADASAFLEERLAGTEDIRSSGATAYVMRHFYELMRARLYKERRAGLAHSVMILAIIGLVTVGNVLALLMGAYLYRAHAITIGTVYMILYYTDMVFRPLILITRQMQEMQKATASIERIQQLYGTAGKIADGEGMRLPAGALPVEFQGVSFGYEGDETVLQDLSFHLQPGRVLGLLGRTGSGKTTLTRLLFRLYDPQEGHISLAGVDIRRARLAELRRRIGMVTQDVQLFEATVRDNLTLFDRSIDDKRILRVLQELGLSPWYEALPQGLDTELASGGGGLSAGEAQLLAFTRVFLRDPGLVVLDEASSRLDPATEQLIELAVGKLLQGRTAIIIAHRLATVHRADEIMIIDNGRVYEHGEREPLAGDPSSRFSGLLQTGLEEALA